MFETTDDRVKTHPNKCVFNPVMPTIETADISSAYWSKSERAPIVSGKMGFPF